MSKSALENVPWSKRCPLHQYTRAIFFVDLCGYSDALQMQCSAFFEVIAVLSFSPTAFGIFFLMTARDTEKYEDRRLKDTQGKVRVKVALLQDQNGTSGVMAWC